MQVLSLDRYRVTMMLSMGTPAGRVVTMMLSMGTPVGRVVTMMLSMGTLAGRVVTKRGLSLSYRPTFHAFSVGTGSQLD